MKREDLRVNGVYFWDKENGGKRIVVTAIGQEKLLYYYPDENYREYAYSVSDFLLSVNHAPKPKNKIKLIGLIDSEGRYEELVYKSERYIFLTEKIYHSNEYQKVTEREIEIEGN